MSILSSNKTLSIDFGADEIKIVEGKFSKKGVVISKNFSIKVPRDIYQDGEIQDMDQLSYLLKTSLSENKISQADVIGIINSSRIIMREVVMPKVGEKEIESILSYQLEDYIPIHTEDYVVKYITLGAVISDGVEKLNILLIGIPRTTVESHLNLLKNINLKPMVLDYQGNAISKLIQAGDTINEFYPNTDTIACIDLGYDSTSITITNEGVIKVSRIIELAGKQLIDTLKTRVDDITENELINGIININNVNENLVTINNEYKIVEGTKETIFGIMDRIEMIFRYYRTREMGNDINLVILHGGLSNIKGIEKTFSDTFNIPCVKLNSLSKIKFDGDLSKYANAIGGMIRVGEV